MITPTVFIFDLNGTMIDDMHFHTLAWHNILNSNLGMKITWEDVKVQMYGKNSEVLGRIFGKGYFTKEEADKISNEKEKLYQKSYLPQLRLIDGLGAFLNKAKENEIKMAIGSAAIPFNIDFVLDNLNIRHFFQTIVSADDVADSKPHPETFLKAALNLQANPADCIVFEDAPKGVEAAQNAGIACIVLKTVHEKHEFSKYNNVVGYIDDFTDPLLDKILPVRQAV